MRRALLVLLLVAAGAVLLILLAAGFSVALIALSGVMGLHRALGIDTQQSQNYDFVSGVGPMIIASLGFSGFALTFLRHVNCEQPRCWRLGHTHPGHGRPVCRKHYHADVAPEQR